MWTPSFTLCSETGSKRLHIWFDKVAKTMTIYELSTDLPTFTTLYFQGYAVNDQTLKTRRLWQRRVEDCLPRCRERGIVRVKFSQCMHSSLFLARAQLQLADVPSFCILMVSQTLRRSGHDEYTVIHESLAVRRAVISRYVQWRSKFLHGSIRRQETCHISVKYACFSMIHLFIESEQDPLLVYIAIKFIR